MKLPPGEKPSRWQRVDTIAFLITVALFMLVSPQAGMQWMGIMVLSGAGRQLVVGYFPFGWERQEPSGYITGISALALSLLMGMAGAAMLLHPSLMLALFGWTGE